MEINLLFVYFSIMGILRDLTVVEKGLFYYLMVLAKNKEITTYGEISEMWGIGNPQLVGGKLSPIQEFCIANKLPPLTSLVVNKQALKPGSGYIVRDKTIAESQQKVFEQDWTNTKVVKEFLTKRKPLKK